MAVSSTLKRNMIGPPIAKLLPFSLISPTHHMPPLSFLYYYAIVQTAGSVSTVGFSNQSTSILFQFLQRGFIIARIDKQRVSLRKIPADTHCSNRQETQTTFTCLSRKVTLYRLSCSHQIQRRKFNVFCHTSIYIYLLVCLLST